MKLSKEQIKIVDTVFDDKIRFVNVYAGPGSGKSTMIAYLISEFIDKRNYSLEDFICISFTNESWKELRDKIIRRCDNIHNKKTFKNFTITTFHKYCAALCKKDEDYNRKNNEKLKKLTREERISIKNEQLDSLIEDAIDVLNAYSDLKAEGNDQDYIKINEDMLMKKALFLDEAQDLTHDIYEFVCSLMRAVKNATGADLKVYTFSDPDQSIFEYEGANHEYIKDLMEFAPKSGKETGKKLRDVKELFLTSNFRSNEKIVGFTEDYRKIALPDSPRKDGKNRMNSATGKKGRKNSVKFYEVKEGACCNAIIDVIKDKIENKKFKSGGTIGILVPKNDESYNIYEILKKEYIDNLNIIVKTTGNNVTSFKLIRLDEFHSFLRILYEENGYGNTYNIPKCIEKFEEAYKTSKYKDAVVEFFDDFRKYYEKNANDRSGKNNVIDQAELDKFIELLYGYTFDEFCCDYVDKKRIVSSDSPQIEIMVSTIHKAKGHEFDYVFMACLDRDRAWLNKKDDKGFEKCRYVAMTRAKNNLYIFNDKLEEKYFGPVSDKEMIDMTDIKEDSKDFIFLSCGDMVLSFLQYCYYYGDDRLTQFIYPFTQFIPSDEKDDEWVMFPDTPDWLQAGRKLELENVMSSETENNRFVFISKDNDGISFFIERLAKQCWQEYASYKGKKNETKVVTDDSIICRIVEEFEKCRDTYKAGWVDPEEENNLLEGQREKISSKFEKWCKEHLEIEIGAVVVVNNVNVPWVEDENYEDKIQYYKYYNNKPELDKDRVKDTIYKQLKYYKFNKSDHCDYFDINDIDRIDIDKIIPEKSRNRKIMEEMSIVTGINIKHYFDVELTGAGYEIDSDKIRALKSDYKDAWEECEKKVVKELKDNFKKQILENAENNGFSRKVILPKIKLI